MEEMANDRTYEFIRLRTKPTVELCYSFSPAATAQTESPGLVVFINGLGLPQTGWEPSLRELRCLIPTDTPATLTYDRYGQGRTVDRDPADLKAPDPSHSHDCMSAVSDMHQLILQITKEKMGIDDPKYVSLVMVGNSIGCALIRLYAQEHPGSVSGALLLDSTLTDSDFVSIFPDPEQKDILRSLPPGVTLDNLRNARARMRQLFHPDVGNGEGLSRRNLALLLPHAHSPVLEGPAGSGPYVTVVGHDFDTFSKNTERDLQIPYALSNTYMNTYWDRYNHGLARLTQEEKSEGPVQAPNAGHFIQVDNAEFVASKLRELLQRVAGQA